MDPSHKKAIADWRAAYELRHRKEAPELHCHKGWFYFSIGGSNYRMGQIVDMTNRLLEQANGVVA